MKLSIKLFISALILGFSSLSYAAANPLSVHILDLETGQPMKGVTVTLEQQRGNEWRKLKSDVTNEQGRIVDLFPAEESVSIGVYRVIFKTGEHYAKLKRETFFPEIPVHFYIKSSADHYHIPLLLSPFGFSTYRGN